METYMHVPLLTTTAIRLDISANSQQVAPTTEAPIAVAPLVAVVALALVVAVGEG